MRGVANNDLGVIDPADEGAHRECHFHGGAGRVVWDRGPALVLDRP